MKEIVRTVIAIAFAASILPLEGYVPPPPGGAIEEAIREMTATASD